MCKGSKAKAKASKHAGLWAGSVGPRVERSEMDVKSSKRQTRMEKSAGPRRPQACGKVVKPM